MIIMELHEFCHLIRYAPVAFQRGIWYNDFLKKEGDKMKSIKQNNMESLSRHIQSLYTHPRLTYLFFELTDACNLTCLHCGSNASPCNRTYLPLQAALDLLESVSSCYPPQSIMICLTGGEPMLHPGLLQISARATELGFTCGMTTNATLIRPEMAQRLADAGIRSVSVSLDGLQESHDWFRNSPGAFERAIQGIRALKSCTDGRIYTQITSVIHKKNFHELESLFQLACELDVDSWRLVNLEPIGRALDHPELQLDRAEHLDLLKFIRKKRFSEDVSLDVTFGCSHYLTEKFEHEVRDWYYFCGAGTYIASVLCNGDIYPCLDIERRPELVQGNIYRDSFSDVWENKFHFFRADRSELCYQCKSCKERMFCRGDSAHTWDYNRQQPLLCLKKLFDENGGS